MISGLRSSLFFERLFSIGHRCLLPIFIGDIRQTSRSRVCNPYIVYNPVTCARCINTAFAFTMGKNIEIVPSACNSFLADDNSRSDLSCLFTTIYLSPFYPSPCNSHYTLYRQVCFTVARESWRRQARRTCSTQVCIVSFLCLRVHRGILYYRYHLFFGTPLPVIFLFFNELHL